MRSHQLSQISHFRIKYEFSISFKREIRERLDKKKVDVEDEILIMGYLLMKRKMRKRRNHRQQNSGSEKYFCKGNRMGHICEELRLKNRESFFR